MDPSTLQKIVEEAVRDGNQDRLWILFVVFVVVAIAGFVSSYLGTYLQSKGRNLATKEDFQQLLEQNKEAIKATEEIRSEILRRSSFRDKVLLERYHLINDINSRLENVRINYERMKKGQPSRIEIVNGETLLLTEIYAELQLKRSILTPSFFHLLLERYDLVSTLWQHKDNNDEWNQKMSLWFALNNQIQTRMEEVFEFEKAEISAGHH